MFLFGKISVLFFALFFNTMHPLHISMTNIEYDEVSKKFIITMKYFKEDLRFSLAHSQNIDVDFSKELSIEQIEAINKYIISNFLFEIDNSDFSEKIVFVNKKINEDSVWLTYEFGFEKSIKNEMKISNSVLFDAYRDQTNMIIVNYKDFQEGYQLKQDNPQFAVDLK